MDWIFFNFVISIVKSAVPLFFMISGVLFLNKKITIKTLYQKYILRIVTALFLWSLFYAAFDYIEYLKDGEPSVRYFVLRILSGHYHLWFLPAILGVYICLPVLKSLVESGDGSKGFYLLGMILVTVVGKSTVEPFLTCFYNTAIWDAFWRDLALSGFSVGIVYFLLGYYLDKYKQKIPLEICIFIFGASVLLGSGINLFFAFRLGEDAELTHELASGWILLPSMALFVIFERIFDCYHPGKTMAGYIKRLSDCTFGIYLIHTFFLERVYPALGFFPDRFPYIISIFLFSFITFIGSFCVVYILKKIPVVCKYAL